MRDNAPLLMQRRPSVILAAFLLAAHGVALVVLATVVLPLAVKGVLLVMVLLSAWYQVRGALLRDPRCVSALELHGDGRAMVQRSGQWLEARIAADCYVTRWLIVLRLKGAGIPASLVLAADSLAAEDHRKLRVWLRHRLQG